MRFASLGSGSQGNALLVSAGATTVMVDCGFGLKDCAARLGRLGLQPDDVDAILVTHEHGDHLGGVARFAARHGTPVWLTHGTARHLDAQEGLVLKHIAGYARFAIGDLEIAPFPVPHDASEPAQFTVGDGARRLGILTDAGSVTPHMVGMLTGCQGLFLECNHDEALLRQSDYPPSLIERVAGDWGHLSNTAAADLLRRVAGDHLQHVVAAHLSQQNNRPELARDALGTALGCAPAWIAVADQADGLDWRQLT
ncbi:MAG: MBL fold metallo-hydrolase [Burkholderiales bacterium]|jgi:phosphoribosyl 1,2-cyclic phosphodiesterase|nr:MBL fold metallo-hydrolase [Betaproteobacteria bacterium]